MDYTNSQQFLIDGSAPLPHRASTSTTSPCWNLKEAYPQLETLDFCGKTIWTKSEVENLPAHLTSLSTACPSLPEDFRAFMIALPHSLVELILPECPMAAHEVLPLVPHQSWQHLHLSCNTVYDISKMGLLPPTLTTMDGLALPSYTSNPVVLALPLSLTTVENLHTPWGSNENLAFGHLRSLTSIGAPSFNSLDLIPETIRTLPQTLQRAFIEANLEHIQKSDWPRDLVSLDWAPLGSHFPIEMLPPTLTEFKIEPSGISIPFTHISLLPRTLTSLHFYCSGLSQNVEFPPALRTLFLEYEDDDSYESWVNIEDFQVRITEDTDGEDRLADSDTETNDVSQQENNEANGEKLDVDDDNRDDDDADDTSLVDFSMRNPAYYRKIPTRPKVVRCFPFHKLPQSITSLTLPCMVPASQLKHLPTRLVELHVTDIFEDSEFDSKDESNIAHMREIYRIGKLEMEGVDKAVFNLSSAQALESSMASLLPRTLVNLTLLGDIMPLTMDWPRIPPCLETLNLGGSHRRSRPISLDFLFEAPLSHLKCLAIVGLTFTDAHMKALPRKLDRLDLSGNPWLQLQITPECAVHRPLNLIYGFNSADRDVQQSFSLLDLQRGKALAESDLPTFRKLLHNMPQHE